MAKAEKNVQKEKQRILTPRFRVSYPHLFKPNQIKKSDKPKYGITMLFAKNEDLSVLKAAIKQAKIAEFGDKSNWPENMESPVSDGDDPKFAGKEGYKGHWVVKATSSEDQKPGLVDEQVKPILDQSKFYPGCYARAYVFARVWEFGGEYGVQFILDHVQKLGDGKSLGSKKAATEVFGPVSSDEDDFNSDDDDDDDVDFK